MFFVVFFFPSCFSSRLVFLPLDGSICTFSGPTSVLVLIFEWWLFFFVDTKRFQTVERLSNSLLLSLSTLSGPTSAASFEGRGGWSARVSEACRWRLTAHTPRWTPACLPWWRWCRSRGPLRRRTSSWMLSPLPSRWGNTEMHWLCRIVAPHIALHRIELHRTPPKHQTSDKEA